MAQKATKINTIARFSKGPQQFVNQSLSKIHTHQSLSNESYTFSLRYLNEMFRHCDKMFPKLNFNFAQWLIYKLLWALWKLGYGDKKKMFDVLCKRQGFTLLAQITTICIIAMPDWYTILYIYIINTNMLKLPEICIFNFFKIQNVPMT